jgi:hypothetical protein
MGDLATSASAQLQAVGSAGGLGRAGAVGLDVEGSGESGDLGVGGAGGFASFEGGVTVLREAGAVGGLLLAEAGCDPELPEGGTTARAGLKEVGRPKAEGSGEHRDGLDLGDAGSRFPVADLVRMDVRGCGERCLGQLGGHAGGSEASGIESRRSLPSPSHASSFLSSS